MTTSAFPANSSGSRAHNPAGTSVKDTTQFIPANERMTTSALAANSSGSRAHPGYYVESDEECEWDENVSFGEEPEWEQLADCLRVLEELEATFGEDEDAVNRGILGHIINEYPRAGNRLQPSETQHQLVRELVESGRIYTLRNLTNSEWLDIIGDGSILFSLVTPEAREDIEYRACAVVNALCNSGETNVTLMDGHGRIVYQIMAEMRARGCSDEDLDRYTFTLYDLDEDVHAWHDTFMPSGVTAVHDDILCSDVNTLRDPDELPGVVYLNFCGIGDCVEQTRDMVSALVRTHRRHVLVSYSIRGVSRERITGLRDFHRQTHRMTTRPNRGMCSQFISEHGRGAARFVTYGFCHMLSPSFDNPDTLDDSDDPDYDPEEDEECECDCGGDSDCECGCHEESCAMEDDE